MKLLLVVLFIILTVSLSLAQDTTGAAVQQIVQINDAIEKAFLDKNVAALDTLFGNDLLFIHGSGKVDTKKTYLIGVPKGNYLSRTTDSTRVEVHDKSAFVTGRVIVVNGGEKPKPSYGIKYVRLYLQRNNSWILVSHRTVQKWDEQKAQ